MKKVALSPAGLQELLQTLYVMSDVDLELEALQLKVNFRSWVGLHFYLEEEQLVYLQQIDDRFVQRAGEIASYYLQRRLPINLNKMSKPESMVMAREEGDRGKLLDLEQSSSSVYSPETGYGETEALSFRIRYLD